MWDDFKNHWRDVIETKIFEDSTGRVVAVGARAKCWGTEYVRGFQFSKWFAKEGDMEAVKRILHDDMTRWASRISSKRVQHGLSAY